MVKTSVLVIWLFLIIGHTWAQNDPGKFSINYPDETDTVSAGKNELTIFIIPSKVSYDWTSPYSLYKSYVKNYSRNIFKKEKYILGHTFIELRSPLIPGKIFTGMRTTSRKEQRDLVLRQHYGLAILGADMEGELETNEELEYKVIKYSQKGQLAFMTFYISDDATRRLLEFFRDYQSGTDSLGSHGLRYGGAFWPRYRGEGSGCSAFVVSFLDLAGLLRDQFSKWLVRLDIPMELIGGPYNNYNDVRFSDIKKHKTWTGDCETYDPCYEHLEIYDPTLMYDWVLEMSDKSSLPEGFTITPVQLNHAEGIRVDGRNVPLPKNEDIFMDRGKPSLFIDYYHQKFGGRH